MLPELVHFESPSGKPHLVNEAVSWVEGHAQRLSGRALRHPIAGRGDLLEMRFGPQDTAKPLMLLGHLDTVWPAGTLARMPFRIAGDRAYGPGILDMKAGVVMAIVAIDLLRELKALPPVVLLLSSDEEVGSGGSRALIERLARQSAAVFVMEPAQGDQGAYKTARKGVGHFRLEIAGIPAHSGVDFEAGHSAVLELARQLERIAQMTDVARGTTFNPGVIGGGTLANVIAAEAWAEVDVRVRSKADAAEIESRLQGLTLFDPACRLSVTGGLNRPPMERTDATVALFERARAIAAELGFSLEEAATGGGSDGNFTSALGVPTLDGMGAVGNGAHAENESILIESLVPRTALLASMIAMTSADAFA